MSCPYYSFRQGDFYCNKKCDYVKSDYYYKYCRNYDYDDCPIYKGDDTGGCYLTSACMYSKGLSDDCYELKVLRDYRDTWLNKNHIDLVKQYYEIAPQIVQKINNSKNSREVYDDLYENMVLPCVILIENEEYDKTLQLYENKTKELLLKYKI